MRFEFLVEETMEQRLRAVRAHLDHRYFSKKNLRKTYLCLGAGFALVLILNMFRPDFSIALDGAIFLALGVFMFFMAPLWRRIFEITTTRVVKAEYAVRQNEPVQSLFAIDEQKIALLGGERPWSRRWQGLWDWLETPEFLLLYLNKDEFLLLPKDQLAPEIEKALHDQLHKAPQLNG